jgi:hypothetical protein
VFANTSSEKKAQDIPTHFATWKYFEADKLSSVWLIKRFINPEAKISVVDEFTELNGAVFFDTPSATFARSATKATFEHLTDHFNITDTKALQIGKFIHDTEINSWQTKLYEQTNLIEIFVSDLIAKQLSDEEAIEMAIKFFDGLYESLELSPIE